MRSSQPWPEFIRHARPHVDWLVADTLLTLDPGETTGWSLWKAGELLECGQWPTPQPADLAGAIHALAAVHYLDLILYEEYRVRGNKYKEHVGSEVVTIQNIGAIKVVADELETPLAKQSAGMAKGFATDAKLRRWGLYRVNQRHANDAIRHGVYHLLFHHAPENRQHVKGTYTAD